MNINFIWFRGEAGLWHARTSPLFPFGSTYEHCVQTISHIACVVCVYCRKFKLFIFKQIGLKNLLIRFRCIRYRGPLNDN